jgi:hypothetical protein
VLDRLSNLRMTDADMVVTFQQPDDTPTKADASSGQTREEREPQGAPAPLTITVKPGKRGPRIDNGKRDEAIWRALTEGEPSRAVADRFGLTQERVRQIYAERQRDAEPTAAEATAELERIDAPAK